jgi:hypothetical protein
LILTPELNINFEFTAPGTPQQNGKVGRALAILFVKPRSMLNAARITIQKNYGQTVQTYQCN